MGNPILEGLQVGAGLAQRGAQMRQDRFNDMVKRDQFQQTHKLNKDIFAEGNRRNQRVEQAQMSKVTLNKMHELKAAAAKDPDNYKKYLAQASALHKQSMENNGFYSETFNAGVKAVTGRDNRSHDTGEQFNELDFGLDAEGNPVAAIGSGEERLTGAKTAADTVPNNGGQMLTAPVEDLFAAFDGSMQEAIQAEGVAQSMYDKRVDTQLKDVTKLSGNSVTANSKVRGLADNLNSFYRDNQQFKNGVPQGSKEAPVVALSGKINNEGVIREATYEEKRDAATLDNKTTDQVKKIEASLKTNINDDYWIGDTFDSYKNTAAKIEQLARLNPEAAEPWVVKLKEAMGPKIKKLEEESLSLAGKTNMFGLPKNALEDNERNALTELVTSIDEALVDGRAKTKTHKYNDRKKGLAERGGIEEKINQKSIVPSDLGSRTQRYDAFKTKEKLLLEEYNTAVTGAEKASVAVRRAHLAALIKLKVPVDAKTATNIMNDGGVDMLELARVRAYQQRTSMQSAKQNQTDASNRKKGIDGFIKRQAGYIDKDDKQGMMALGMFDRATRRAVEETDMTEADAAALYGTYVNYARFAPQGSDLSLNFAKVANELDSKGYLNDYEGQERFDRLQDFAHKAKSIADEINNAAGRTETTPTGILTQVLGGVDKAQRADPNADPNALIVDGFNSYRG